MKPAPFDWLQARTVDEAVGALVAAEGDALVVAGSQSLGPMLNLRLVQPSLLVDIRGIAGLAAVDEADDGAAGPAITYGSLVTHAAIEDGRVADGTNGLMPQVARGIAYRAIRTCGTIGGSVCHADPAGDWGTALTLLSATALIEGPAGRRAVPIEGFFLGPFGTVLAPGELLVGLRVPRLPPGTRWAYEKCCRKPGEFAESIVGMLRDEAQGTCRIVVGANGGAPVVIDDGGILRDGFDPARARAALASAGLDGDPYLLKLHLAMMQRAALEVSTQVPGGRL
jgi:carbon-monoxide dehydrogenase medium subunit